MNYILGLLKRAVKYYITRVVEVVRYLWNIAISTAITGVAMIPLVLISSWVLTACGVDMGLPPSQPGDIPSDTASLIVLCLAIGLFEETWFRYLVQDCLLTRFLKMPTAVSLILASVLFGAVHLFNPGTLIARLPQAIGATGAGIWFGLQYRKRGLHHVIFVHALYDFIIMSLN